MTTYRIEDKDGDGANIVIVCGSCQCSMPGCREDVIEIYEDGEIHPYRTTMNALSSGYILGLLNGEYSVSEERSDQ